MQQSWLVREALVTTTHRVGHSTSHHPEFCPGHWNRSTLEVGTKLQTKGPAFFFGTGILPEIFEGGRQTWSVDMFSPCASAFCWRPMQHYNYLGRLDWRNLKVNFTLFTLLDTLSGLALGLLDP
jgi:hypothetical protein